jgi:hypothetical protein
VGRCFFKESFGKAVLHIVSIAHKKQGIEFAQRFIQHPATNSFTLMKKILIPAFVCFITACSQKPEQSPLTVKKVLTKGMKEISGIVATKNGIWAIKDKPHAIVYKLDTAGNLVQEVDIKGIEAADVEAVTADDSFVYIGDVGDNIGDRGERKIIKVAMNSIPKGEKVEANGEVITFTFPGEETVESKKDNNYDCESLLSYRDSLYLFTKDREDKKTRLYAIPKTPGNYAARFIDSFDCDGLITDAAINPANNLVALIGYHKGHNYPFMIFFRNFKGDDFLSGEHNRIELADKEWDWQLEGISLTNDMVYFSCEGTPEVPATFYGIKLDKVNELNKKGKEHKKHAKKDKGAHMSLKGHLKA